MFTDYINFWFCKIIVIFIVIICLTLNVTNATRDDNEIPEYSEKAPDLPIVKYTKSEESIFPGNGEIVLAATIDGFITAFDAVDNGKILWKRQIGDGPLLSTSTPNFNIAMNGEIYEIVPSFDGSIYIRNGKVIAPLPYSSYDIFRNSLKMYGNYVVTGGMENSAYGVDMNTGKLQYTCNIGGCQRENSSESSGPLLVIKRNSNITRTVELSTGEEIWKFITGDFEVSLENKDGKSVHSLLAGQDEINFNYKVDIPSSYIGMNSKEGQVLWKHNLHSPIVKAWALSNRTIRDINLFEESLFDVNKDAICYLGLYKEQTYIQLPPVDPLSQLATAPPRLMIEGPSNATPSPAWNAVAIKDSPLTSQYLFGELADDATFDRCLKNNSHVHGEHPRNVLLRLFLYPFRSIKEFVKVAVSFVFILLTSCVFFHMYNARIPSMAKILNLFRQQKKLEEALVERKSSSGNPKDVHINISEEDYLNLVKKASVPNEETSTNVSSRFWSEFEDIKTLGQGGYGVVFSAKNKIDAAYYAVKRISLPKNAKTQEKMKREAQALASLDHRGIVRYYNCWIEELPSEWSKNKEREFSIDYSSYSNSTGTALSASNTGDGGYDDNHSNSTNNNNDVVITFNSKSNSTDGFKIDREDDSSGVTFRNDSSYSKEPSNLEEWSTRSESNTTKSQEKPDMKTYLYIQMQLCQPQSLADWLENNSEARDPGASNEIFLQIVEAVEFLHAKKFMHRDLKPSNILFSQDGCIKVGDFGLACAVMETTMESPIAQKGRHTHDVGTRLYMSPEQLSNQLYDLKVDIFSLGLIYLELESPSKTGFERLKKLDDARKTIFPDHLSEIKVGFLKNLLSLDPIKRPTASEIKDHPLFATNLAPDIAAK